MTELPAEASGSLLDEIGGWLETDGGVKLRPWQRALLERAWTVDSTGELVFRTVVVSTPRQSGKSWLARAWAIGRCQFPALFGDEPQTVVHLANRHNMARRIHEQAWGWAVRYGLTLRTAMGRERIIWPDRSTWEASTLGTVYGMSANGVLLDEAWKIEPEIYRQAVVPVQAERAMPQALIASTANRDCTDLMAQVMADGRLGLRRTMLADWGARAGDDPNDPDVWMAASPHWTMGRAEEVTLAVGSPEFASQWLNVWPGTDDVWRWLPRTLTDVARRPLEGWPDGVCGVESRWAPSRDGEPGRWAVAVAAVVGDGVTLVKVVRCDTLVDVVALVGERRVLCHETVRQQLAAIGRGWRVDAINTTAQASSGETLASAIRDRRVKIDGISDEVWASVRVRPTPGGDVIEPRKSLDDVAGVKAVSYALQAASTLAHSGPVLVA